MPAVRARELDESLDSDGRKDEWHRESERIREQQPDALREVRLGRRVCKDASEDRADARRPSGTKGDADQNASQVAERLVAQMQAPLACEGRDVERAEEIEAEENHE